MPTNKQNVRLSEEQRDRLIASLGLSKQLPGEEHIAEDRLIKFVQQQLNDLEAEAVEAHLFTCDHCLAEMDRVTEEYAPLRGEKGAMQHLMNLTLAQMAGTEALEKIRKDTQTPVWVQEKIDRILPKPPPLLKWLSVLIDNYNSKSVNALATIGSRYLLRHIPVQGQAAATDEDTTINWIKNNFKARCRRHSPELVAMIEGTIQGEELTGEQVSKVLDFFDTLFGAEDGTDSRTESVATAMLIFRLLAKAKL